VIVADRLILLLWDFVGVSDEQEHCLWKEILSQQRIRHFKILQSIYFAYTM